MNEHVEIAETKERVEQEYDALITQLNRCQGQLSGKSAQVGKLSPGDYRTWLDGKKLEQAELIAEIQAKKAERAEACRAFNSREPAHKEKWLPWPDCEGWWWCCHNGEELEIYSVFQNDKNEFHLQCGDLVVTPQDPCKWKFQPEPELPR